MSPAFRYAGPPMTLGNMRANGVRRLDVSCLGTSPRLQQGGAIGGDARPNWADQGSRMVSGWMGAYLLCL